MSSAYFTPARRVTVQTAIGGLPLSAIAKSAALLAFDDLTLAEMLLRTVMGDEGPSHEIGNISYVAWLIANERLELERQAAPLLRGD